MPLRVISKLVVLVQTTELLKIPQLSQPRAPPPMPELPACNQIILCDLGSIVILQLPPPQSLATIPPPLSPATTSTTIPGNYLHHYPRQLPPPLSPATTSTTIPGNYLHHYPRQLPPPLSPATTSTTIPGNYLHHYPRQLPPPLSPATTSLLPTASFTCCSILRQVGKWRQGTCDRQWPQANL